MHVFQPCYSPCKTGISSISRLACLLSAQLSILLRIQADLLLLLPARKIDKTIVPELSKCLKFEAIRGN